MCGICGIVNFDGKPVDRKILVTMQNTLSHRGPDDEGIFIYNYVGLAHRRLAIIDPSVKGHQPMSDSSRNYRIIFNGEIFNYRELAEMFRDKGYIFQTQSDTEIILCAYKEFGGDCVNYFIGQFAFAIWDIKKKKLFLARDRVGINPLYYATIGKTFIFASEIKSILASGLISKEINKQSIYHFLSMYAIPAPYTIFKDVISLLPGYTMSVSRNITKKHQYWDVPIGLWKENKKNLPRLKEELQIILNSAVSYAAVSDVPVGVFLSGGIDSSLLVAFLSRVSKSPIRSFTCWSSDGGVYDERLFAMEVAKKYNTIHTEYTVTEEEAFSDLVKMVYYLDQPDGGGLESFFITKKASGLKVCLAGAGGDELFAGYHEEIYLYNSAASVYQFTPYLLRKFFIRLLVRLFANKNDLISGADKLFSQKTLEDRRFFLYFPFLDEEKRSLFSPDWSLFRDLQTTEDFFKQFYNKVKEMHPIDRFMYVDLKTFTPSNILQNMDTMSMAHSLEVRSPLLDHRLIKLAAEIPPSLKRKRNIAKYILKEVAKSYLPKDVIYHKKTGFGLPRARYMRTRLRKYILEMLSEESVKKRGIFNPLIIKNILTDFYQRQKPYKLMKDNLRIWALLVLEIWFRLYIDRKIVVMPKLTLDDLI